MQGGTFVVQLKDTTIETNCSLIAHSGNWLHVGNGQISLTAVLIIVYRKKVKKKRISYSQPSLYRHSIQRQDSL